MFDKLIESDTAGADFKNRSRYFTVSTIIVGILFLTAVVYSLYAAEVGLGAVSLDVAELVAPLDATEPKPEPEPDRPQTEANSQASDQPTRQVFMESTDVSTRIPQEVSVTKNPYRTTSADRFIDFRPGPADSDGPSRTLPNGITGTTSGPSKPDDDADTAKTIPPPVIAKKPPSIMKTSKVLNGDAISLPKPSFPQTAVILNLQGSVRVQVTIDEKGNVISAKAADGHPLFRGISEQAARNAKFRPTLLNDAPVKVTGLIVYNFKRN